MRAPGRRHAALAAALLLCGGCATFDRDQAREAFRPLTEQYRREARKLRAGGEKRKALERLRVVAAFHPEDETLRSDLADLERELQASAEKRFRGGQKQFDRGKTAAARKEFILALADNPDHAGALDYLKNRLARDSVIHTVARGESLESIASRSYGDPKAAVLIARLNNLGPGEAPKAGTALVLPAFREPGGGSGAGTGGGDTVTAADMIEGYIAESETQPVQSELAVARGYLAAGNFEETLIAANALTGEETAREARELVNAAHYGLGKKFQEEERYFDSLKSFEKADPSYRDVKKLVAAVKKSILAKAEEHYLAGVRFFIDQKLEKSIEEWEKTLELHPGHRKAKKDLVKARRLIEQLQKIR